MDSFSGTLAPHPVVHCVAGIGAALDDVDGLGPVGMTLAEKQETLLELSRQIERAQGLKLAIMAAAEDVAAESAARDLASWLAPRIQADHGPTKTQQKVAEAIEARWHRVGTAIRSGGCSLEQAKVIVAALDELPREVPADLLAKAEAHLVAEAAHFTPKELRKLGEKILEVIAPDIAEDAEREKLERELQKARRTTRLSLKNRGDGTTDLTGKIPDSVASRLKTYLDALSSPQHDAATGGGAFVDPATGERLPADRVRGLAFCAMLERIDPRQCRCTAAPRQVSTSPRPWRPSGRAWVSGSSTTAPTSRPVRSAGWPATPTSSRSSSVGSPRSSIWAASAGSTPGPRNAPWRSTIPPAAPKAAPSRPGGATRTISPNPGPRTAAPTSKTANCCAPGTTPAPTTTATSSTSYPTETSASTNGAETQTGSAASTRPMSSACSVVPP